MLGVLTYLFYLLSKPNIPLIKQIATAKVMLFCDLRKNLVQKHPFIVIFLHFFRLDMPFLTTFDE